jgi:hypothetical protein
MVERGPTVALDLTHVLCALYTYSQVQLSDFFWLDDDSSWFSLALALVTLSPILLMVALVYCSSPYVIF